MLGLPVRVVRSHKARLASSMLANAQLTIEIRGGQQEKRSSYAPEPPAVRYDGIYRIEKCWRHAGGQGMLMCRYLFVRCDNEPAPWTADGAVCASASLELLLTLLAAEHGDRPRPLPDVKELKSVTEVFECKGQKWWDFDPVKSEWGWTRPPPESQKPTGEVRRLLILVTCVCVHADTEPLLTLLLAQPKKKKLITEQQRLLKEFGCKLCGKVLSAPLSTPCGHTFCKVRARFLMAATTAAHAGSAPVPGVPGDQVCWHRRHARAGRALGSHHARSQDCQAVPAVQV